MNLGKNTPENIYMFIVHDVVFWVKVRHQFTFIMQISSSSLRYRNGRRRANHKLPSASDASSTSKLNCSDFPCKLCYYFVKGYTISHKGKLKFYTTTIAYHGHAIAKNLIAPWAFTFRTQVKFMTQIRTQLLNTCCYSTQAIP